MGNCSMHNDCVYCCITTSSIACAALQSSHPANGVLVSWHALVQCLAHCLGTTARS